MESHRNFATNTVGFLLLPSELIQHIILRLALPDVVKLKSVSRSISSVISEQVFVRNYNLHSRATTWLFVYKKRWRRDSMLHGYTNRSGGWFKIGIADMLKSVVPPGEDLYLLTASGNFFLFALNNSLEVISVNPMSKTVRRIPPSPLGPRGTSSWRRSGMKLLSCPSGADHFRFLFAEMDGERPILFEYDSRVDSWSSTEAVERNDDVSVVKKETDVFLSAYNGRSGSVVIAKATGGEGEADSTPVVLRPRFTGLGENGIDRLHVYGDGKLLTIKSKGVADGNGRVTRMLTGIELWGVGPDRRRWEVVSAVPEELMGKIRKPYGAMMGCMERRRGAIRAILMSNLEGAWDIIWLTHDVQCNTWDWVPITDCKMKGANMAGIAFSSGLTL